MVWHNLDSARWPCRIGEWDKVMTRSSNACGITFCIVPSSRDFLTKMSFLSKSKSELGNPTVAAYSRQMDLFAVPK